MSQISWKTYVTSVMTKNFTSLRKIDKYFRHSITESMSKAIEENWIRILGIDYEIISIHLFKSNEPLGISLEGRNIYNSDSKDFTQRHYLRAIRSNYCIGATNIFAVGDELLEVNGLKIYGMSSKDVVKALKKLPNYIQIVVARSLHPQPDNASDNCDLNEPISFYDMDDDDCSRTSTLKSNSSLFSMTSRDFGSLGSVGGLIEGRYAKVSEYLRDIIGWRGPIVLEFKKQGKESLGLALEELKDPLSAELIIVFKIILPHQKASDDGRLHVGDRLLQVNGKSVNGVSFRKVCQWIKSAHGGRLVLYICKPHFPNLNIDSSDIANDSYLYNTLKDSDKLPKLREETESECFEFPPVPESHENCLSIKKNNEKLGVFLDVVENGKNGCRIKKMTKGLAKDSGLLHEGDYLTTINGISMRVDEKNKLENALRMIAKTDSDYFKINYLTKEDVEIHRSKYQNKEKSSNAPSETKLYPDTSNLSAEKIESVNNKNSYDEPTISTKSSFESFTISICNDGITNLGLILCPSLNDPSRYVAITGIHTGSLAEQSGQLKINDEIISVNSKSVEYTSPSDLGIYLKKLMLTEDTLRFKVKRLIGSEDESSNQSEEVLPESTPLNLTDLPDLYQCTLKKSHLGYGFSVQELHSDCGVIVKDVEIDGGAHQTGSMKPGHRFIMISDSAVITSSIDTVIKAVKVPRPAVHIVMETSKYREFDVEIVKDSSNSLGLNVIGGVDTKFALATIESILPKTTCNFSEKLQTNDVILIVNGSSLFNLTHDEIISVLRNTPRENVFRILRKLPFLSRPLLNNIQSPTFLHSYRESCLFSVAINKPVNTVLSFGINFGDVVILDPTCSRVIRRYKSVLSVENGSLFEKYAPEVTTSCYLVEVNRSPVDVTMSCEELKRLVDSQNHVELLFSKDVPYYSIVDEIDNSLVVISKVGEDSHRSSISDMDLDDLEHISEPMSKKVHFQEPNMDINGDIVENELCTDVPLKTEAVDNHLSSDLDVETEGGQRAVEDEHTSVENVLDPRTEEGIDKEGELPLNDRTECIANEDQVLEEEPFSINSERIVEGNDPNGNIDTLPVCFENVAPIEERDDESSHISDSKGPSNEPEGVTEEVKQIERNDENDSNETLLVGIENLTPSDDVDGEASHNLCPDKPLSEPDGKIEQNNERRSTIDNNHLDNEGSLDSEVTPSTPKDHPSEIFRNPSEINPEETETDFSINIENIVVPKLDNKELGFNVIGGVGGGPGGETLPVYVVGTEQATRNWPDGREGPFLPNGCQLLEMNGVSLAALDLSAVERLLVSVDGDLSFKVLRLK